MAALPTPSGFSPKTVEKAVNALLKWRSSKLNTQKPQLLEHDEFVYLILTLKKIPHKGVSRINAHKIPLPCPLTNPLTEAPELCLIIDDRPKSGLNKDAAKKKIQNDNIPISKIIKISKLKTDYRDIDNHADNDVEKGSDELLNKKRRMGDNKGKGEKKVAKLKKEDGFKQKKAKNEDVTKQKKLKKNALALESGGMQVKDNKKKRLAA
ncbi:hypothetical protein H0E87_021784 [Populus deltoides]|uniref:Uncharacterized protein n=1 Tax=Populus deltoides TaxID=3696 RepID=A0A8T2XFN6_POPDE|nr:hypothetical protein H0E87_021784 [Populus deltoides]